MELFIAYSFVSAIICLPLAVYLNSDNGVCTLFALAFIMILFGWLIIPIMILIGFAELVLIITKELI